jgi:hypothetical protein
VTKLRDRARIELTFLDGERLTCEPVAIGQFSFDVRPAEGVRRPFDSVFIEEYFEKAIRAVSTQK